MMPGSNVSVRSITPRELIPDSCENAFSPIIGVVGGIFIFVNRSTSREVSRRYCELMLDFAPKMLDKLITVWARPEFPLSHQCRSQLLELDWRLLQLLINYLLLLIRNRCGNAH